MLSSRATSATLRSESMTRCAASTLYSVVNLRLVGDMGTSFREPHARIVDVHNSWGASVFARCVAPVAFVHHVRRSDLCRCHGAPESYDGSQALGGCTPVGGPRCNHRPA